MTALLHVLSLWPEFFGCFLAISLCFSSGFVTLRLLGTPLTRLEERIYSPVLGAALVSLLVFALGLARLLYPVSFLISAGIIATVALLVSRKCVHTDTRVILSIPRWQWAIFLAVYVLFAAHYLCVAIAPEVSGDGSTYHTGLIARYLRDHQFAPIYTNTYAGMPQGAEFVYLTAFAFGQNAAAALVQATWWMLLPWAVLCVCARIGKPQAGLLAGLLLFTAPVVGLVGSTAYVDVFLMTTLVAAFGLCELWVLSRSTNTAALAGLLAGYCVAIKFTAFPAPLYLAGLLLWHCRKNLTAYARSIAIAMGCAFVVSAPWLVRNWILYRDPLFPLGSGLFATPYMHPYAEAVYRSAMRNFGGVHSWTQVPLELTVRGKALQGFLGPVFLLLPLAFLALRWPVGKRLLLAGAVFLLPYSQNIGTRFFLPIATFWMIALCLVLMEQPSAALLVGTFGIVTAWPGVFERYCDRFAPRVVGLPKKVIVGKESAEDYKKRWLGDRYDAAVLVDQHVGKDARVLSLRNIPDGYTHAEIVVSYQGALNGRLYSELNGPFDMTVGPWLTAVYQFQPVHGKRFRLLQTTSSSFQPGSIFDLRATRNGQELPIEAQSIHASPNPLEAKFAVDSYSITRWNTAEPARPGMYFEFSVRGTPDRIAILTTASKPDAKWILQGLTVDGVWTMLDDRPVLALTSGKEMRCEVAQDLKRNGVRYVLLRRDDPVAKDFQTHREQWGDRLLGSRGIYSLYALESRQ